MYLSTDLMSKQNNFSFHCLYLCGKSMPKGLESMCFYQHKLWSYRQFIQNVEVILLTFSCYNNNILIIKDNSLKFYSLVEEVLEFILEFKDVRDINYQQALLQALVKITLLVKKDLLWRHPLVVRKMILVSREVVASNNVFLKNFIAII